MLAAPQILAVIVVALAMVPALAHALEMPGKMRLGSDAYFAVQRIYYPGFTIAGVGEPAGFIAVGVLLLLGIMVRGHRLPTKSTAPTTGAVEKWTPRGHLQDRYETRA